MIKSFTISTTEVDDAATAVKDIADKAASITLLKNSMGIITAHPDFVTSGIYAKVAKSFPFPIIGKTSISHCANDNVDSYMLSVLVLTSDECTFSCGLSDPIPADSSAVELTRKCYGEAAGKLGEKVKLAFMYAPFFSISPRQAEYLSAISEIDKSVPVFGGVANDDIGESAVSDNARVLYNGENYDDRLTIALVCGPVDPKFYIASVTEDSIIMPRVGVITAVKGNKLLEINNVSAPQFLKDAGFLSKDNPTRNRGLLSSIFVLHIKDENGNSADFSRIPAHVDDESVYCGGVLATGAVLSIAFNTGEVVLETAKRLLNTITDNHGGGTAILHSCIGRRYGLLSKPQSELELIRSTLGDNFNFTAGYANGEICPIAILNDKVNNQEHNQTLIACVF